MKRQQNFPQKILKSPQIKQKNKKNGPKIRNSPLKNTKIALKYDYSSGKIKMLSKRLFYYLKWIKVLSNDK